MDRYVVFSHGKESGPWGTKISALADIARVEGYEVESVDYRGLDDPRERVTRLLAYCRDFQGRLVLVGSSMGGHVSVAGSRLLRAAGMFLIAPAFYMPGYEHQTPQPAACPITIVHGWRDDVVPVEHSVRFSREYAATLHVLDTDHRMQDRIAELGYYFEYFLATLDKFGE
ncbi:MAG TPA: alpha/beta hydrolase [Steroidobacteraceae bacterium]|nr:alpha/beta hydrolase [Steroidobacteraceae bacterium]